LIVATLDTNVLISALLFEGTPQTVLRAAIAGKFELVLSPAIIQELATVLARPKFGFPQDYVHNVSREIEEISILVQPTHHHEADVRDPKDQIIIDCAVEAGSDYIVTGDQDLLVLKQVAEIAIVSPGEFLDLAELR